jgi:hypothetical protein
MGGAERTAACLVVASDEEVARAYNDAVLRMTLEIDVTAEDIVDQ